MVSDELRDLLALEPDRQTKLDAWTWEGGLVVPGDGCAAAVRRSNLHPHRSWLVVAAGHAAAESLDALIIAAAAAAGQAVRIRTWNRLVAERVVARGGNLLISSHLVTVDAAALPLGDGGPTDVVERDVRDPAVADVMWSLYRRIHEWDPVAADATAPEDLSADLVVAGVVQAAGRVIGVAAAHEGDPAEAALVGFLEPIEDEARATLGLVHWLVERRGTLEVEADEGVGAHPALVEALRSIPGARWAEPLPILEYG